MFDTALHIFTPRRSNDFKAKLLHFKGLAFVFVFLLIFQIALNYGKHNSSVLGYAANISTSEVIRLTNLERAKLGLSQLTLNQNLAAAAKAKGEDMLANDYWAHVSPQGKEPWDFFNNAGYSYRYAGENLARDFSNPSSAIDAWLASPSHRENMLSDKYKEIGIAVVEGDLSGVDTTIIVQLFGTQAGDTLPVVPVASANDEQKQTAPVLVPEVQAEEVQTVKEVEEVAPPQAESQPVISPFVTTKNTSLGVLFVLFLVLVSDMVYVELRGITRKGGRTMAHLSFLVMILIIVLISKAGQII